MLYFRWSESPGLFGKSLFRWCVHKSINFMCRRILFILPLFSACKLRNVTTGTALVDTLSKDLSYQLSLIKINGFWQANVRFSMKNFVLAHKKTSLTKKFLFFNPFERTLLLLPWRHPRLDYICLQDLCSPNWITWQIQGKN